MPRHRFPADVEVGHHVRGGQRREGRALGEESVREECATGEVCWGGFYRRVFIIGSLILLPLS